MKFGHRQLYIGGKLQEAQGQIKKELICPGDLSVSSSIAWAHKEDTLLALEAAESGFRLWSALTLTDRLEWIEKLRLQIIGNEDLLRESIMYEMGKNWAGGFNYV